MRQPSFLVVCCALTLTLVGCTTSEQAKSTEPADQPTVPQVEEPKNEPAETPNENENEQEIDEPNSTPESEESEVEEPKEEQTKWSQPLEIDGMANFDLDTLILVNKKIALPSDYQPEDLVPANIDFVDSATGERRMLRKEAATAIESLMQAAKSAEIDLKGTSAFRSYAYQVQLFDAYVARDGKEEAMKYSAPPGHSEHQTGLAIDISSNSVGYSLTQELEQTKEGKWLADNAHTYGFIVRYQRAYEKETGYMYEPWHLRYVGVEHATAVHESNVPFEQYLQQLMN